MNTVYATTDIVHHIEIEEYISEFGYITLPIEERKQFEYLSIAVISNINSPDPEAYLPNLNPKTMSELSMLFDRDETEIKGILTEVIELVLLDPYFDLRVKNIAKSCKNGR